MTDSIFESLFKKHFAMLSNIANAVVKDDDQAKDIVQQVFIRFWDKRNTIDIDDNIVAYLKKAVVNTSLNHIEKQKRLNMESDINELKLIEEDNNKEQKIETVQEVIKSAIAQLPNKCQTVFSLSKYEGMTNKEIADYLDISIKAVEKHKSRALKELRETLKPYQNFFTIILIIQVGLSIFILL